MKKLEHPPINRRRQVGPAFFAFCDNHNAGWRRGLLDEVRNVTPRPVREVRGRDDHIRMGVVQSIFHFLEALRVVKTYLACPEKFLQVLLPVIFM